MAARSAVSGLAPNPPIGAEPGNFGAPPIAPDPGGSVEPGNWVGGFIRAGFDGLVVGVFLLADGLKSDEVEGES